MQETDLVRAGELARAGAALARLVGDRRSETQAVVGEVPIHVDLGRWDEAIRVEARLPGERGRGPGQVRHAAGAHLLGVGAPLAR